MVSFLSKPKHDGRDHQSSDDKNNQPPGTALRVLTRPHSSQPSAEPPIFRQNQKWHQFKLKKWHQFKLKKMVMKTERGSYVRISPALAITVASELKEGFAGEKTKGRRSGSVRSLLSLYRRLDAN
ncbi:hypothetical protein MA16_Dca012405 [Dendrobium catenatum]|uniref:Uncharacterized protein n=1 Tax=Dendrobium catenatum TaxID=906689 RepID=A0A2I0WYC2_9ASPA|nr:hypothetical protein MA16_Dca012405 [Dendrobium catenatum]